MPDSFKKKYPWIYIGVIFFILFFSFFGQKGILKIHKLKKDLFLLQSQKDFLEKNNTKLSQDILFMKKERDFQERISRETLGLAREDEIIYEFLQ